MTLGILHIFPGMTISTHTSLAGRDHATNAIIILVSFLLTRPSRDVTPEFAVLVHPAEFLLTRPSRDVTQCNLSIRRAS